MKYEWKFDDIGMVRYTLLADGTAVGMVISVPWGWIICNHVGTDGLYKDAASAKKAVEVLVGADGHDD